MTRSKHFLAYWKPETADANLARGGVLNHSASEQYGRVSAGDTVWIVTARTGRLFLLGRIAVDCVVDQPTAERILGERDLWHATYHIIAKDGTEVALQEIAIRNPSALRFESTSGKDRLTLVRGRVDAKQLQAMRLCTDDAVDVLTTHMSTIAPARPRSRKQKERSPVAPAVVRVQDVPVDILRTLARLQQAVHPSLLHPSYRDTDRSLNPLNGYCYRLAEAMHHLFPGEFHPHMIKWGPNDTHWFLRTLNGEILEVNCPGGRPDPSYVKARDYAKGRRKGFQNPSPSSKTRKLIARAGLKLR